MRIALGLTQSDAADAAALAPASYARLEVAGGRIAAERAEQLAWRLQCSLEALQRPVPESGYSEPRLRAYADAPKKTVERYLADTLLAVEAFEAMGLRRVRDRLPTYDAEPSDLNSIEELALLVRQAAGEDPAGGVRNVTRAAERLGCIVLPLESELGRHLGMSTRVSGIPVIRAARAGADLPGDRQRFTVAHELGHLLIHSDVSPPGDAAASRRIEREAHRFASAFLLPGDPFVDDFRRAGGRATLSVLADLKSRWGVSIKAMVVRLGQLGIIDEDHSRSLYKQISSRGWNKNEPVEVGGEKAVWLRKAALKRFPGGLEEAVRVTALSKSWLERWIDWEIPDDTLAEVISLRTRIHA